MRIKNINDLLPFLDWLDAINVYYRLEKLRDGAIIIKITLSGRRIELEVFADHVEVCTFVGSETVEINDTELLRNIEDFIR
jgi:predicted MarR family transcription regulator